MSVRCNRKWKYIFMLPQSNSAYKGLINQNDVSHAYSVLHDSWYFYPSCINTHPSDVMSAVACRCQVCAELWLTSCGWVMLQWACTGNTPTKLPHWNLPDCKHSKYHCEKPYLLTHCWDKMAANFLMTSSNAFSWMKIYKFRLGFPWKFVAKGPIDNIPALVQIMVWHQPDKPLSETMMASLLTYMCHSASVNL